MKFRLVNDKEYEAERIEVVDGRLEIDIKNMSAEEVQEIFSVPANLNVIELLTEEDEVYGELQEWTVYGGVMLNGDIKTAILIKPKEDMEKRITAVWAEAVKAVGIAESSEKAVSENAQQITDLQMALCEIYEGMVM